MNSRDKCTVYVTWFCVGLLALRRLSPGVTYGLSNEGAGFES